MRSDLDAHLENDNEVGRGGEERRGALRVLRSGGEGWRSFCAWEMYTVEGRGALGSVC